MDFFNLMQMRYSVRAYKNLPVEEEKLAIILEAARMAPTACNKQPFQIYVIKTAGKESELKRIYKSEWFTQAPIVICICAIENEAWTRSDGKNYGVVDAVIAMDHLILAAADLDLGTCWIAAFDPDEARKYLKLPEGVEPIAFTPIGYPEDSLGKKKRKSIEDLVEYL